MNFKKSLETFNELDLQLYKVVVANEVDNYRLNFDIEIDDEHFEIICRYVYDWIMNTDAPIYEVVEYLIDGLRGRYYTYTDITMDEDVVKEYINSRF